MATLVCLVAMSKKTLYTGSTSQPGIAVAIRFSPAPPVGVIVRWINRVLYVEQVFGGRIQKNTLLPVARQPDGLQSRLLILHYLENYAKFQVSIHQRKLPSPFTTAFIYVYVYFLILFLCVGVISSRTRMSSCATY